MRNRVAIITLSYGINYGNRLQNYALQEVISYLGLSSETLVFVSPFGYNQRQRIIIYAKDTIKRFIRIDFLRYRRKKVFHDFNRKYIITGRKKIENNGRNQRLEDKYDYFIVGSDQVWNTSFDDVKKNIDSFLILFAPNRKRIAYAASFGRTDIDMDYYENFAREIPKFKAISVREIAGERIIGKFGRKATVVLDPTMLLTTDVWCSIVKMPKYVPTRNFIVTYFLGNEEPMVWPYISRITDGKEVVRLYDVHTSEADISNPDIYCAGPDEFIWYISHASYILTDSFHGAVFSILFHKPFQVFDRLIDGEDSNMGSRLDTLLSTFGLEHCRGDISKQKGDIIIPDWEKVDRILENERQKSMQFLKKALDIES